jgi:hypothetical protein
MLPGKTTVTKRPWVLIDWGWFVAAPKRLGLWVWHTFPWTIKFVALLACIALAQLLGTAIGLAIVWLWRQIVRFLVWAFTLGDQGKMVLIIALLIVSVMLIDLTRTIWRRNGWLKG